MNNLDFEEYKTKKEEYNQSVQKLNTDFNNQIILKEEYDKNLIVLKNNFKSYLGSLFQMAENIIKEKLDYDFNIYTSIKTHNAQLVVVDSLVIMNQEEFEQESEKILFKIKNSTYDNATLDALLKIHDYLCTYHNILLEEAPKREVIENSVNKVETSTNNNPIKKEKIKVSFFIKFLPTIIIIGGLLIAYIIYYYL